MVQRAYHVTTFGSLPAILAQGLLPHLGARAARRGAGRPAVHLFPDAEGLDGGGWLFEEFPVDERLVLLRVEIDPKAPRTHGGDFGIALSAAVPPEAIAVLDLDYEGTTALLRAIGAGTAAPVPDHQVTASLAGGDMPCASP